MNDSPETAVEHIAIIGMAGRFPSAGNVDEFWERVRRGEDCISHYSREEMIDAGYPADLVDSSYFVPAHGELADADKFDAEFFGYTAREAEVIDPQHRILLECAVTAMEDAGVVPGGHERIGVVAGQNLSTYFLRNILWRTDLIATMGTHQVVLGNDKDYLSTRLAYKLNLNGPCYTLQTGCSTSLVAVHYAVQDLLTYNADVMLAGGVTVNSPIKSGYTYVSDGINSPDGRCRAFDHAANGTVGGDGVALVVLKRLEDAQADRNHIHAVILGSAVNNDGATKLGFTAPSVSGQAECIAEAIRVADIDPETVGFVEGHGTATSLGDPVEIKGLTRAYRKFTAAQGYCGLGSVKSNIGHLDSAAGVAGLIKAVQAVKAAEVPATVNFVQPNPATELDSSPFYVSAETVPWPRRLTPRRAGVSSLGLGGTNVHVIIQQAPMASPSPDDDGGPQLLTLSAKTPSALNRSLANLRAYLSDDPHVPLADVAWTLQSGRMAYPIRYAIAAEDHADAMAQLRDIPDGATKSVDDVTPPLAFVIPGHGTYAPGLAAGLYRRHAAFTDAVDTCIAAAEPLELGELKRALQDPSHTEPTVREACAAVFTLAYALAQTLRSFGLEPDIMAGHSLGEYAAACLSDVLSPHDAMYLVDVRARLWTQEANGGLTAVFAPQADVAERLAMLQLDDQIGFAAVNGPASVVVSGSADALDQFECALRDDNTKHERLNSRVAPHSPLLDRVLDNFRRHVETVTLKPPTRPYISGLTGETATSSLLCDPNYWVSHFRETIRFDRVIDTMRNSKAVIVEVGPGRHLSSIIRQQRSGLEVMTSAANEAPTMKSLLQLVGALWQTGIAPDWGQLHRSPRTTVRLSTYPFDRDVYWLGEQSQDDEKPAPQLSPPNFHGDNTGWTLEPIWSRSHHSGQHASREGKHVLIIGSTEATATLAAQLRRLEHRVTLVLPGQTYQRTQSNCFTSPLTSEGMMRLLDDMRASDDPPDTIVHAMALESLQRVTTEQTSTITPTDLESSQRRTVMSVVNLVRVLENASSGNSIRLVIASDRAVDVTGVEPIRLENVPLTGAAVVLAQEYPQLRIQIIDQHWNGSDIAARRLAAECVFDEPSGGPVICYRGRHRWEQSYLACRLAEAQTDRAVNSASDGVAGTSIRYGGRYVIDGGLDALGADIAAFLVEQFNASIVVFEPETFPSADRFDEWLATRPDNDPISERIRRLRNLRRSGAVIHVTSLTSGLSGMSDALATASNLGLAVNGIFHTAGFEQELNHILVRDVDMAAWQEFARARAHPLLALIETVQHLDDLDFVSVLTPISSQLGGLGRLLSAATGRLLGELTRQANRKSRTRWIWADIDDGKFDVTSTTGSTDGAIAPPFSSTDLGRFLVAALQTSATDHVVLSSEPWPERIAYWLGRESIASTRPNNATLHPRPTMPTPFVAPRNDLEDAVADEWQSMLGVGPIGVDDDFFALGGHSLMATQLVANLRQRLRVDVAIRDLFEGPTIAELASHIVRAQAEVADIDTLSALLDELEEAASQDDDDRHQRIGEEHR
ncbi:MAG TPA: beta-ketoacyl synthase N-terminal-like domain-containing protein [Nitrospira sp.]|nr:beta-ketoacyl synthase N-terminal-like domain-containing protein [Nitrospira sp.]